MRSLLCTSALPVVLTQVKNKSFERDFQPRPAATRQPVSRPLGRWAPQALVEQSVVVSAGMLFFLASCSLTGNIILCSNTFGKWPKTEQKHQISVRGGISTNVSALDFFFRQTATSCCHRLNLAGALREWVLSDTLLLIRNMHTRWLFRTTMTTLRLSLGLYWIMYHAI